MKTNNKNAQEFLQVEPIEVQEVDLLDVVGGLMSSGSGTGCFSDAGTCYPTHMIGCCTG